MWKQFSACTYIEKIVVDNEGTFRGVTNAFHWLADTKGKTRAKLVVLQSFVDGTHPPVLRADGQFFTDHATHKPGPKVCRGQDE